MYGEGGEVLGDEVWGDSGGRVCDFIGKCKDSRFGEFPGVPVARTPRFHC